MSLINTAVGLVALTDPVGVLPLVIQAASANPHTVRRISRLAATTYLLTLVLSCWWGQPLLDLFGISLPAFRIAGGLILLPYGLRLIEGISIGSSPMALDHEGDVRMMAVVPIGLPRLMGVLIASVATQMLVSGLRESFPVLAG